MRDSLAYAAHTDDAQNLSGELCAKQRRGRPAGPFTTPDELDTFADTARHANDPCHGKISSIVSEYAWRIGDENMALRCGFKVDMLRSCAEIGDQTEVLSGGGYHIGVDPVRHCRDQHIEIPHSCGQIITCQRVVVRIEHDIEQVDHAVFHAWHEMPRDEYPGFTFETFGVRRVRACHRIASLGRRRVDGQGFGRGSCCQSR